MKQPYFVFSLPRSRSFWLASWLGAAHDLGLIAASCQDWAKRALIAGGSVETGMAEHWRTVRRAFPQGRFLAVRRDLDEVIESLDKFGLVNPEVVAELEDRDHALAEMVSEGQALSVDYWELGEVRTAAWMWEYLQQTPFDFAHWRLLVDRNLQVDMEQRCVQLVKAEPVIAALRRETRSFEHWAWVGPETWPSMCEEGVKLAAEHFGEANPLVPQWYKYHPNMDLLGQMASAGVLKIWTARVNCELVGYILWTLSQDPEAFPQVIADQGAWYIQPKARPSGLGLALLRKSVEDLKALGVNSLHLHHPTAGRGAKLAPLFEALGASRTQVRYTLWLGETPNAQC
jgi:hypothetical protein